MSRQPTTKPDTGFALPIADEEILVHFPDGVVPNPVPPSIYLPYAGKITASTRTFRQPVQYLPDAASFSAGLELFMADDPLASSLYIWFAGTLRWRVAQSAGDESSGGLPMRASLRLELDTNLLAALALNPGGIETPPAVTIYENLDQADVTACVSKVIRTAYDQSATLAQPDWHPVLTGQFTTTKSVKQFVDAAVGSKTGGDKETAINTAIGQIVTSFTSAADDAAALRVRNGDLVAHAALTGDSDPAKARQVVFYTLDKGRQFLDPLYYLHLYLHAPSKITIFTIISPDQPLIALFPALLGSTRPAPRVLVNDPAGHPQLLIPIGHLGNDHSFGKSKIQWRYDPVGGTPDPGDVKFFTTPHQTLTDVSSNDARTAALPPFWNAFGGDIAAVCKELAVPCELATAIVGHETSWNATNPAVWRLEPLTNAERDKVKAYDAQNRIPQQLVPFELKYDYTVGILSAKQPATAVTLDATSNKFKAQVSSKIAFTLRSRRTLQANQLTKNQSTHRFIVISDTYRPLVLSNTATGAGNLAMTLGVVDERFASTVSVGPTGTVFVALGGTTTSGDRTTVEQVPARAATLRALRIQLSTPGTFAYGVTVTVVVDGQPTALATTVKAGATSSGEVQQTVAVTIAQKVALQITSAGAVGAAAVKVDVECYLAPANGELVVVADGTQTGVTDAENIPDPWDPDAVVRDNREGKSLTWGELATVLDVLDGQPMSPGFMQTLISTARDMVTFVQKNDPDALTNLEIPALPKHAGDFIRPYEDDSGETVPGWLVVPKQSFFAGIARIRWGYNGHLPGYDLPLVCGNYNGGGKKGDSFRYGVVVNFDGNVKTGRPGYVDDAAARFGIVVDFFASLPAGAAIPTVRLKR
ncbi:MAG: hypothetical protein ACJ8F1_15935 [Polyangia bacterium]